MKIEIILSIAVMIIATSCAVQKSPGDGYTTDIFTPLVQQHWVTQKESSLNNDIKRCTVHSSHNGVGVVLQKARNAPLVQRVISSTSMEPSTILKVQVNNHFYRTRQRSFSDKVSAAIIEDFKVGDVVYVEWSELHPGTFSSQRRRVSNKINLTDFNKMYSECLNEVTK